MSVKMITKPEAPAKEPDLTFVLARRVTRGKEGAYMFHSDGQAWISSNRQRFEVLKFYFNFRNHEYKQIILHGELSDPIEEKYSLIFDENGPEENSVRFVLYKGEKLVLSSLDVAEAYGWAEIKLGESRRTHIVAFVIRRSENGVGSALISDADPKFVNFVKLVESRGSI